MIRATLVATIACALGCGFHPASGHDLGHDAAPGDAAGGSDAAGDLGITMDGGGGDLSGAGCALPMLLVGVEDLSGATLGGRVLRFQLGTGGPLVPCATYSAQGALPAQPLAIAFVPPDGVAAATRDGLYLIGPGDVTRFSKPIPSGSTLPVTTFALATPAGATLAVVGYWHGGTSNPEVDHLDAFTSAGAPYATWNLDGTQLPFTSGVADMTQNLAQPTHLLALDVDDQTTYDVDPAAGSKTTFQGPPAVSSLVTIHTASDPPLERAVWVDATSNGVFYTDDQSQVMGGPLKCPGATCTLVDAVPDPTEYHRFLGLCETPATTHRVIVGWSSTGGSCDTLYDGADAGANTRLSRLAIAN